MADKSYLMSGPESSNPCETSCATWLYVAKVIQRICRTSRPRGPGWRRPIELSFAVKKQHVRFHSSTAASRIHSWLRRGSGCMTALIIMVTGKIRPKSSNLDGNKTKNVSGGFPTYSLLQPRNRCNCGPDDSNSAAKSSLNIATSRKQQAIQGPHATWGCAVQHGYLNLFPIVPQLRGTSET